jgi:streptomycin 3"-adenylyltransferase
VLEQIDEIARVIREVLGEAVIGIYLEGSAVVGGLRPRSDIDVFAVTSRSATFAERRSLVYRLMAISDTGGPQGRPVELTIVVRADVRPWRYAPMRDFQYGEWVRADYERGKVPVAEPDPDLALLMTGVLTADRALFGPPPTSVLDPVPLDDVRRATLDAIPGILLDLDADTRNGILTLARIWTTVATGTIRSKDAAADWALPRLPEAHREVLARARAIYLGEVAEGWDDLRPQVRVDAGVMVAMIERSAPDG